MSKINTNEYCSIWINVSTDIGGRGAKTNNKNSIIRVLFPPPILYFKKKDIKSQNQNWIRSDLSIGFQMKLMIVSNLL
jgi:hypothetical protein